jgi:hypothetical protein
MSDPLNLTTGQLANLGAYGLVLGTAFFVWLGLREERDFFLMMGLMCTLLGNLVFAGYLWDQDPAESGAGASGGSILGGANETMVTLYLCLAVASVFGLKRQFDEYREKGWNIDSDDEDDSDGEDEKKKDTTRQQPQSKKGGKAKALLNESSQAAASESAEERAEKEALRQVARDAIRLAKQGQDGGGEAAAGGARRR